MFPLPLELPVSIVKPLRDRTALEKHRVILECTVSSPRCSATWYKGREELVPSDRVEILADGCSLKLVIQQVSVEDEGTYSIEVGEHTSKAKLMVEGKLGGELRTFEKCVSNALEGDLSSFTLPLLLQLTKRPSVVGCEGFLATPMGKKMTFLLFSLPP